MRLPLVSILFLTLSFLAQCSSLVFSLARIAFAWSLERHVAIARAYQFTKRASDSVVDFSKLDFFWVRNLYPDMGQGLYTYYILCSALIAVAIPIGWQID